MIRKQHVQRVVSMGLLALLVIMGSHYSYGQEGVSRKFTIVESSSRTPLSGVTLINKRTKVSTSSNTRGIADLLAQVGDTIETQLLGYKSAL